MNVIEQRTGAGVYPPKQSKNALPMSALCSMLRNVSQAKINHVFSVTFHHGWTCVLQL